MSAETRDESHNSHVDETIESCKDPVCHKEKSKLRAKCIEQEEQLKEINQGIEALMAISQRKAVKPKKTADRITPVSQVKTVKKTSELVPCTSQSNDVKKIFANYEYIFTSEEVAKLRKIGSNRKEDSTFILHVIRFLYKDDMDQISGLTISGRSAGNQKQKISSIKYNVIRNLYAERLKSLKLHAPEFIDREKQANKHIKNAFSNLLRKMR